MIATVANVVFFFAPLLFLLPTSFVCNSRDANERLMSAPSRYLQYTAFEILTIVSVSTEVFKLTQQSFSILESQW